MSTETKLRPKLSELAARISENAKIIEDYIEANNLPYPSFAVDGPTDFPVPQTKETQQITEARQALITASKHINDLVTGPDEYIRYLVWNYTDVATLDVITKFEIPKAVPLDGDISYSDLAIATKTEEKKLRQILRLSILNHVFYEPRSGYVAHTAGSKLLREDPLLWNWVAFNCEDLAQTSLKVSEMLEKFPNSGEHDEASFALAHGSNLFQWLGKNPAKAKRFGMSMASHSTGYPYSVEHLVNGFAWDQLPKNATVVDVGANTGFVSVEIAKHFPEFNFVIQDKVEALLKNGESTLPAELKPRFQYVTHDFLTDQPTKGADVYLIRWCMHNWSDKYALQIIKSLVPALKNGSKVVFNELTLPEPNSVEHYWEERRIRTIDFVMLMSLNALEREEGDWKKLFEAADPRFRFDGSKRPPGSGMSIIEATFVDQ